MEKGRLHGRLFHPGAVRIPIVLRQTHRPTFRETLAAEHAALGHAHDHTHSGSHSHGHRHGSRSPELEQGHIGHSEESSIAGESQPLLPSISQILQDHSVQHGAAPMPAYQTQTHPLDQGKGQRDLPVAAVNESFSNYQALNVLRCVQTGRGHCRCPLRIIRQQILITHIT